MSRKFISSIVMAAVAATSLTVSAAPARANDDLAKFLFGATALVIIGSALANDGRAAEPERVTRPVQPRPVTPRPNRRKALTAACIRKHQTYNGKAKVFGQRCLQKHYRHADSLPNQCKVRLATTKGTRRGYSIPCLKDHGYYIVASH